VILSIVDDTLGHLWLETSTAVIRIDHREIDRAIADPSYRMELRRYEENVDLDNGLPIRIPRAALGPNQTLWLVTTSGLFVIDPRRFPMDVPGRPCAFETVDIDGRSFEPTQRLTLPPAFTTFRSASTALTLQTHQRQFYFNTGSRGSRRLD